MLLVLLAIFHTPATFSHYSYAARCDVHGTPCAIVAPILDLRFPAYGLESLTGGGVVMAYHRFVDDTGAAYGSFEVFYASREHVAEYPETFAGGPGWYFWPCFPGCIPDGDAWGPFPSERKAVDAARDNF